jgi:hypothetical protein
MQGKLDTQKCVFVNAANIFIFYFHKFSKLLRQHAFCILKVWYTGNLRKKREELR